MGWRFGGSGKLEEILPIFYYAFPFRRRRRQK